MKKPLLSILLVILCLLMTGCHKEKESPIKSSIVTRMDILCEDGDEVIRRCYTSPDKMRLLLLYFRSVRSPFASLPEPQEQGLRKIHITTVSANHIVKVYRQYGDRYFQEGDGGWQQIEPEKGGILWELIMSLPDDPPRSP